MRVKNESAFQKQNRNRHLTGVKLARIVVKMSFVFVIVKDFHPWTFRVSFQRVVDISILLYARTQVFFFLSRWTNTLSIKKTKTKTQHFGKKINTSKNLQIQSNSKLKRTELFKKWKNFKWAGRHIWCCRQDPAALAQLMKNMPLTNDGKFLLLDAESSDTVDGDGLEDLESEA